MAVGAVIGLRPVVRRIAPRMRKHGKQMMAGQVGSSGETGHSMRDCCEPMTAGSPATAARRLARHDRVARSPRASIRDAARP